MKTQTAWKRTSDSAIAFFMSIMLMLLLAGCGGGGGGGSTPVVSGPQKPTDRNTPNYLHEVIDDNFFFRWTAPANKNWTWIWIQVDDETNVSYSMREKRQNDIAAAREIWKAAIKDVGIQIDSTTRFLSEKPEFPSDYVVINISYVDHIATNPYALGETSIQPHSNGILYQDVVIKLALKDPYTGSPLSDQALRHVALHELGHAFGIHRFGPGQKHSTREEDVMYKANKWDWTDLSAGDTKAIRELYSMSPSVVRAD